MKPNNHQTYELKTYQVKDGLHYIKKWERYKVLQTYGKELCCRYIDLCNTQTLIKKQYKTVKIKDLNAFTLL